MPRDQKEPQSYGSQADWTTGKTGGNVNDPKSEPEPEHREFYDERRDSEESAPSQGGRISPVQLSENSEPRGRGEERASPSPGVSTHEGGAKRGSYFKDRDRR